MKTIFLVCLFVTSTWFVNTNITLAVTTEELLVQINQLQARVKALQAQLAQMRGTPQNIKSAYEGIPTGFKFTKNLKYGDYSNEVKYLQIILKKEGLLCQQCMITGWFGRGTRNAVIAFQQKYASEILAPHRLTRGTGIVGIATRNKLNQLLSTSSLPICIPSTPSIPALSSPSNKAILQSLTPTLSWSTPSSWGAGCPDEKRYHIQIDNNSDFSSPLIDTTVSSSITSYTIPSDELSSDTTYYWRVRAENNAQYSNYDSRDFKTSPNRPLTCSDGTPYDQCSQTKPKYCSNGNLIDKASSCGCPSGYEIANDQCIMITTETITIVPANEQVVESFDFENGSGDQPASWSTGAWKPAEAQFIWENTIGHSGSRSLSIVLNTPNDAYWLHSVNLDPQKIYRLTGYIKGENIINREGGNMGAHINAFTWEHTEDLTGTFDWKKVSLILQGSTDTMEIKCRLGFFYNTVTGKYWCDDIILTSDPLTKYEGSNIYIFLEPNDLTVISNTNIKRWVVNLDKAYNAYSDLVGTKPFGGQKLGILSVTQYPGGWAVAGNPIKWMQNFVRDELVKVNNGDWSFGILHEISHDFDLDNRWNWDAEFWANLKMYYAVETLNAKVSQDRDYIGPELKQYYQTNSGSSYDKTLKNGVYSSDGLVYKFIAIKERVGWEPFKQTFRYFINLNSIPDSKLDKFNLFLDKLTDFSGVTVRDMFTQAEMDAITAELSK